MPDRIYGCIFSYTTPSGTSGYVQKGKECLWALESLPLDDDYPALTRNMFSLTSARYGVPGLYKERVIHFGLTVKDVKDSWDQWLDKFEALLETFDWNEARVHLEFESVPTGFQKKQFDYRWSSVIATTADDESVWKFEGGPREFGDQIERYRDHVNTMKGKLDSNPRDIESLDALIASLVRLRKYDEAYQYWEVLKAIDSKSAKITSEVTTFSSWKDRFLTIT